MRYADESHLIRDSTAFAGETPASQHATEGELSAFFMAPRRLTAMFGLPSCIDAVSRDALNRVFRKFPRKSPVLCAAPGQS
jgi:hypothetical protein